MRGIKAVDVNGVTTNVFTSVREAAKHYGVKPTTILYRIKTNFLCGDEYLYYTNEKAHDSYENKTYIRGRYKQEKTKKEFVHDEKKYKKTPYTLRLSKICITLCPYLRTPKPFVGSVKCEMCPHFKHKDTTEQVVYCSGFKFG